MKKIHRIFFTLLALLMLLTSCGYNGYTGKQVDLYSVATNSVVWLNGYSWSADLKCDPKIEVVDEDGYGRTMFLYYEKYYKGSDISFSALIISQGSNEKEVFYYEDINYLVKEQVIYSQSLEAFSDEEMERLKSINDWNKEINYDKCVRKEITKSKPRIPNEKEIKNQIIDEFDLVDGEYSIFIDFLTTNSDNTKYIIYGYVRKSEQEGISFIGLVEKDAIKLNILIPSNEYDYIEEFVEFKEMNYWY